MARQSEQIQDEIDKQKKAYDKLFLVFSLEDPYNKQSIVVLKEYINKLFSLRKLANELGILQQYARQLDELQYKYECNTHSLIENIDLNNLYKGPARFNNNSGLKDKIIDNYNANFNPATSHVLAEGPEREEDVVRFFENLLFNPRFGQHMPTDILVAGELTPNPRDSFFPYFKQPINYERGGHIVKTTIIDLNPNDQLSGIMHYEINVQFDGKQKTLRVHHINKFPDHDVPQLEPRDLLSLLELFQNSRSTGLITHCRAGLGRTGMMELAYLSFINYEQFFNKDGTANYIAFINALMTLRTTVRPRIVQGFKQGKNAIDIAQKLIQLYLKLNSAHLELQQKSYLGDKQAIEKLLIYYQTGKPAFEESTVRENDFITWSSKLMAAENIAEEFKQQLKKEIAFRNQYKTIYSIANPQDYLMQIAQQDISNAVRILCDSQLSVKLGMERCISIILHFQNQRDVCLYTLLKQDYLIVFTAYALKNIANAKQCLINDNLRELIDKKVVLEKYISDPQFYTPLSLEELRKICGNFDFLARFIDCTQVVSPEVLKKTEEFNCSGQLTIVEAEKVKRFLTLQFAIKHILHEKGVQSSFVNGIHFEENHVKILITTRVNNYIEHHHKLQLSFAELEQRATAYHQIPATQIVQNVANQNTSNRNGLRHAQHLLLIRQRTAVTNTSSADNALPDKNNSTIRPGMDGK